MPRRAAVMSRASRWCSIPGRQSRERVLDSSFRPVSQRRTGLAAAPYSGSSGSRRALRRALVTAGEAVERTKLQRIEGA